MNSDHRPDHQLDLHRTSFWGTPTGITLAVFLAAAGLLLIFEHRAHLVGVSPLVLLLLLCGGMHFFMHRGHTGRALEPTGYHSAPIRPVPEHHS